MSRGRTFSNLAGFKFPMKLAEDAAMRRAWRAFRLREQEAFEKHFGLGPDDRNEPFDAGPPSVAWRAAWYGALNYKAKP